MNMPSLVTLSNITGSTPYQIFICASGCSPCYYVNEITDSEIPYSFNIPFPLQNLQNFCLRIKDNDGSIITRNFTVN